MLRTRFSEMFGLAYPIMSAPMAMHSCGTLAAAVSAAGGLGSFYGQSAGFVRAVRPAAEVVGTICDEAEQILRSRPGALLN